MKLQRQIPMPVSRVGHVQIPLFKLRPAAGLHAWRCLRADAKTSMHVGFSVTSTMGNPILACRFFSLLSLWPEIGASDLD